VIDDGSTDDTAQVAKSFSDSRIRYIRLKKNGGVAAATNKGLREASGEFISFLDSDDLWKPNKLECNVTYLDSHPEIQAVFSDLEKFDGDTYCSSFMRTTPFFSKLLTAASYPEGIALPQRFMYLCLLQEVPVKPSTLTVRRKAVQRTGEFNEVSPSGQDWEFFLRLSRFACFGYIDRPLVLLRVLGDATHRVNAERDKLFLLEVLRQEAAHLEADPEALAAARRGIADLTKHLAWHYLATNRRADAFKALFQGFCGTREMGLLLRAMAIWMPDSMQGRVRTYSTNCARRESAGPARSLP